MLKKLPLPLKVLLLAGGIIALAALLCFIIFCAALHYSGKHEWNTVRADLLKRGESLEYVDFVPPPVPDSENFFADPLWADLYDFVPVPGKPYKQTRLRDGEHATDHAIPPLSEAEIAAVKQAFPNLKFPEKATNRPGVAQAIWRERERTPAGDELAARTISPLFAPCQPLVGQISALAPRSSAYIPLRYEDNIYMALPHASAILRIVQLFAVQSRADIIQQDPDAAARKISLIFRLAQALETEPLIISYLTRSNILTTACSVIDMGIKHHVWTDTQLTDFDAALARLDILTEVSATLRAERAFSNEFMAIVRANPDTLLDFGVFSTIPAQEDSVLTKLRLGADARFIALSSYSSQAANNRIIQKLADLTRSHVSLPTLDAHYFSSFDVLSQAFLADVRYFLSRLSLGGLKSASNKAYATQTQINQTRLAIALERYRLAHGSYPDTLDTLVPAYLPSLPPDLLADAPMRYTRKSPVEFLLYSVGLNLTDDSGTPGLRQEGDLVWGYEPPAKR